MLTSSALRILPLGDSITQGSNETPGGYRGFLEQSLLTEGIPFEFVGRQEANSSGMRYPLHEGHPGACIQQLRLGRQSVHSNCAPIDETLREFQPDCVLLLAGTNDLYFACPEKSATEIFLLTHEILRLRPSAAVIIGTILPILPGPKPWGSVIPEDVGERVINFNNRLADYSRDSSQAGKAILLADFRKCVESSGDLRADGVHPTGHVMERMAKIWHQSLIQLFRSSNPSAAKSSLPLMN